MTRRTLLVALAATAALVALIGGFLLSGQALAGGPGSGYGPGMMGGYYGTATPSSSSASASATLLIRHQYAHCHTWSLNGGAFKATQAVTLKRGATLTVIDDDVMPHQLVKLAGASVAMRNGTTMPMMGGYISQKPGLMNWMGAATTVSFSKPGVYHFRTRAGEDFMQGIQTSGADNVLTLTVKIA